jgi:hypothetical protein
VSSFDTLDHVALMGRVRRRVQDKRVLALVKAFLKAGILTELGGREETITGTPQGGILTAPTQQATWRIIARWRRDRVVDGDAVVADAHFADDEAQHALALLDGQAVGVLAELGEEAFEVLGELEIGLGVVQLGVERVELGGDGGLALAQRGQPGAQLVERDELFR